MIPEDEFRIKTLHHLADVARGRRVPVLDVISTTRQKELLIAMRNEGWVSTLKRQVWITREGRKALRCFQRMYA